MHLPLPRPHHPHPHHARTRSASTRVGAWLAWAQTRTAATISRSQRRADDRGATAIEWAVFAILAITIAGLVAAAITQAVNNRLPGIQ